MTDHSTARALVEKLEPCPFCGAEASFVPETRIAHGYYRVGHGEDCWAGDVTIIPLEYVAAWNTRTLTPPEGDTVSDEVVDAINDAVGDAFTKWFDDPGRSSGDELDLRPAIRAALQSRVSPQAGMREALEPFVERLEMLEDNCRKLGCGVPAETNVRTSWLRKLRAASPNPSPESEA